MARPNFKTFIHSAIEKSKITLSTAFEEFVNEIELLEVDYDEFEGDSYGEIGIHYFDIKWKDKTLYARKTEQLEGDSWFWGLPDEDTSNHFDVWLEGHLNASIEEVIWFLGVLMDYYNSY